MTFSIIIATMNGEKHLARALDSIAVQTWKDREVIMQDGGSTDGTAAVAARYGDMVNWRSEPDSGVYDAWNRAVARMRGDWALFLGADDFLLEPDILERGVALLRELPAHTAFAYGDLLLGRDGRPRLRLMRSLRAVYTLMQNTMGLPFPSTFVKGTLLRGQPFDASYRIAGDFDFAARTMTAGNVARLPLTVTFMEEGGISGSDKWEKQLREERERVLRSRVLPRSEEYVRGCIEYMDEKACCYSRKKIKPGFFGRLRGLVRG